MDATPAAAASAAASGAAATASPTASQPPLARAMATFAAMRRIGANGGVNMYRRCLSGGFTTLLTPTAHLVANRAADGFILDIDLGKVFDAPLDPDFPTDLVPVAVDQVDTFLIQPSAATCVINVGRDAHGAPLHTCIDVVGSIDVQTGAVRLDAVDQEEHFWFYFEMGPWARPDHMRT